MAKITPNDGNNDERDDEDDVRPCPSIAAQWCRGFLRVPFLRVWSEGERFEKGSNKI